MNSTLLSGEEMAASYGVTREDLHMYEKLGLLQPATIDGLCRYSGRDRLRLEIVQKGLRLGFTLQEIVTLVSSKLIVAARPRRTGLGASHFIYELRTLLSRQGLSDASVDEIIALISLDRPRST